MANLKYETSLPLTDHRDKNNFCIRDLQKERHYIMIEIKLHGRPLPFDLGHVLHKLNRFLREDLYKGTIFSDDVTVEVIETAP